MICLLININSLANRKAYLEGLKTKNTDEDRARKNAIQVLDYIDLCGNHGPSGILIPKDVIESQIKWFEDKIAKYPTTEKNPFLTDCEIKLSEYEHIVQRFSEVIINGEETEEEPLENKMLTVMGFKGHIET